MEKPLKFIKGQKLMVIASRDEKDVWVANVYFGVDESEEFTNKIGYEPKR